MSWPTRPSSTAQVISPRLTSSDEIHGGHLRVRDRRSPDVVHRTLTRSPHVAAFFAFAPRPHPACQAVAVFAFREHVGLGKSCSGDGARIVGLGPYAVTHERHYAQQSEYTICKKRLNDAYVYCGHEETLLDRVVPQDLLSKYVIPVTERRTFLRKLESMNIHAYSLFRDEAALMQTLAYREIERHDP